MKKLLKSIAIVVSAGLLITGLFLIAMRFSDGPLEIISGGPFKTGELTSAPASWSHLKERQTIEFQTLDPRTSRTVWVATHNGRLFIVSGYMNTNYAAVWKQWPHYLEDDNRIILRIDGKLYEQKLNRIMDDPAVIPVLNELSRKYLGGTAITSNEQVAEGDTWMFEVVDR
ncbi:MAG: hypothetical protein AB8B95_02905 [Pseudohongiellaceae bacterium]